MEKENIKHYGKIGGIFFFGIPMLMSNITVDLAKMTMSTMSKKLSKIELEQILKQEKEKLGILKSDIKLNIVEERCATSQLAPRGPEITLGGVYQTKNMLKQIVCGLYHKADFAKSINDPDFINYFICNQRDFAYGLFGLKALKLFPKSGHYLD